MSGTVESYGDEEKEGLKQVYMGLLACEEPDCTVSIEVKAGSVIIAATATDTSADASAPEPITASALSAALAASGVDTLASVDVASVSDPVTTTMTVTTIVMAIPPSPPPAPPPSPTPDDEPPFVSFLESLGLPAPIVDVLVTIFTLIMDLFAGLFG